MSDLFEAIGYMRRKGVSDDNLSTPSIPTVSSVYNKLEKTLRSDSSKEKQLFSSILSIINKQTSDAINSDDSYCYKFNIPLMTVIGYYKICGITQEETKAAFMHDWQVPSNANMYVDPYYHILLLITLYCIKINNKSMSEHAFLIFMFKIWNGRKQHYIPYCDKRVMRYVVTHMLTKKHKSSNYDTPFLLLKEYFVPTLITKYAIPAKENINLLKNLLMQSFARIAQVFAANFRQNMDNGKKEAQGGLLPLYMKAKESGFMMSTQQVNADEDGVKTFDQFGTTHNRDQIANDAADYIVMNPTPNYHETFIDLVGKQTNVSRKNIVTILNSIHNNAYFDLIYNIIIIILSRTNVNSESDVCSNEFNVAVKKNIISSKNNIDTKKIQQLLDELLEKIFKAKIPNVNFKSYSNVQQIKLRNVVIFGIVYNIRKRICRLK